MTASGGTMFGKHDDDDNQSGFDPGLPAELARLSALSVPQLAAEVMAKGFVAAENPGSGGTDAGGIAHAFSPEPAFKMRDGTIHAQQQAQREADDPTSDRYKWLLLKDLAAEGLQALEHASLILATSHFDGVATSNGYVTTRAGRAALADGSVERVVSGGAS
jgi:hypothetical protein